MPRKAAKHLEKETEEKSPGQGDDEVVPDEVDEEKKESKEGRAVEDEQPKSGEDDDDDDDDDEKKDGDGDGDGESGAGKKGKKKEVADLNEEEKAKCDESVKPLVDVFLGVVDAYNEAETKEQKSELRADDEARGAGGVEGALRSGRAEERHAAAWRNAHSKQKLLQTKIDRDAKHYYRALEDSKNAAESAAAAAAKRKLEAGEPEKVAQKLRKKAIHLVTRKAAEDAEKFVQEELEKTGEEISQEEKEKRVIQKTGELLSVETSKMVSGEYKVGAEAKAKKTEEESAESSAMEVH